MGSVLKKDKRCQFIQINSSEIRPKGESQKTRLDFDYHVKQICKKASKKIHALSGVCNYMDRNKWKMPMKAFIISQFSYCPLVWMFHSRNTKNRVNKIHERALRLVYDDSPYLSFDELLIKDKSVSIHQRNLQLLATEIFKVKNGVSTGLTEDIFHFVNKPYDLRNNRILFRKRNRTVFTVQKFFLL